MQSSITGLCFYVFLGKVRDMKQSSSQLAFNKEKLILSCRSSQDSPDNGQYHMCMCVHVDGLMCVHMNGRQMIISGLPQVHLFSYCIREIVSHWPGIHQTY